MRNLLVGRKTTCEQEEKNRRYKIHRKHIKHSKPMWSEISLCEHMIWKIQLGLEDQEE